VTHSPAALTEVVDGRTGSVRVSGHLTAQGADLIRGTVASLHRQGHADVLLDLADLQGADDAGVRVLRSTIAAGGAGHGGGIVLRDPLRRVAG
jgi:anti-anti-sigma regulatory factor